MVFATAVGFTDRHRTPMAGIREKMEYNDIPESFKGYAYRTVNSRILWQSHSSDFPDC